MTGCVCGHVDGAARMLRGKLLIRTRVVSQKYLEEVLTPAGASQEPLSQFRLPLRLLRLLR